MASATTRKRIRSNTGNHSGTRRFASSLDRPSQYVEGVTGQVRRGYRKTKNMIRRHPGISSAILLAGCGLAAGVLVGVMMRSRVLSRRSMVPSPEAIAEFLTCWRR